MDMLPMMPRKNQEKNHLAHQDLTNTLRFLCIDGVEKAASGHPGMPMGMADVATVLFTRFIRLDPQNPMWMNRDRFILSAGHGSMLLYALGYLAGYPEMTLKDLQSFRQLGSLTAGHPEVHPSVGIETTTGPLGQGLANGVGMALAQEMTAARYGNKISSHYTYVIAGDGCLMEGVSHEAISLAGHLKLSKLIVFFDDNHISIDGETSLSSSEDTLMRFKAAQWDVLAIDGHDPDAIAEAIEKAQKSDKPSLIACRTKIGYGSPKKAGKSSVHGSPLGSEEREATAQALGWTSAPFEVPETLLASWRQQIQSRGHAAYQEWKIAFDQLPQAQQDTFKEAQNQNLPVNWQTSLSQLKKEWLLKKPKLATRQSSGEALEVLVEALPQLIGGSADLTGSNNTKPASLPSLASDAFDGRYIYYGVREHAMAALMNGLALYGGYIPYGGTFLVFSDYCRAAIRLSALMKTRVIYVLTHDSIGLGEDGPTHQPIEHLASLRAMPNLNVFRPADAIEVLECWALALESREAPSVMALTRQSLPTLRQVEDGQGDNLSARGGYVLRQAPDGLTHEVTLIATGSEVSLACEVQASLAENGIGATVVSLPCWRLFEQQGKAWRDHVLPHGTLRVGIEAASPFGWDRYIGEDGLMIGIDTFGASAPYQDLYRHFGLDVASIVLKIQLKHSKRGK